MASVFRASSRAVSDISRTKSGLYSTRPQPLRMGHFMLLLGTISCEQMTTKSAGSLTNQRSMILSNRALIIGCF